MGSCYKHSTLDILFWMDKIVGELGLINIKWLYV